MADLMQVGLSGLLAFQRALGTTSNNIVNASTPGYSRQRVELGTQSPSVMGEGYLGNGVIVAGIGRVYDRFLADQLIRQTAGNGQQERLYGLASQVDGLLGDDRSGLAPALDDFFAALQDLSADPASLAARQALIGQGESLGARFNDLYAELDSQRRGLNDEIESTVAQINSLASGIADLNDQIRVAQASTQGEPNDLLDVRDRMLTDLAALVAVDTAVQGDGTVNVFIGNGQALVVGTRAERLEAVSNRYDPGRLEVAYGNSGVQISQALTGGSLGGVLEFRDTVLNPALDGLGRVAAGLAGSVNAQHALGVDLDGAPGGTFFNSPSPVAMDAADNTGDGALALAYADTEALRATEYRLERNGAAYTLIRLDDDSETDLSSLGFPGAAVTVDGLEISLASGTIADGDSFLIQPVRRGAAQIDMALSDPRRLAAAAPLSAVADAANAGNGRVGPMAVTDTAMLPLADNNGPVTLTFRDDTGGGQPGYVVSDSGGTIGVLDYDPATESSGKEVVLPSPYDGIGFTLGGTPVDGDSITLDDTPAGSADNGNALALAALQTAALLDQGGSTLGEAYSGVVTDVATATSRAGMARDAQAALLAQTSASREAVSGVNLDEEAADLLRYQQAYEASAQIISVAESLFQTVLGALRS